MYRCKSRGSTNQLEPIGIEFPSLAAQINFFQPKEKGRSKLNRIKTKETSRSPKLRSKLKRRKRKMMCCLIALQWAQEAKKLILAALQ